MSAGVKLRISGVHYRELQSHLFPGDGYEAVALALCGRHVSSNTLLVQEIVPVPYESCPIREPDRITWRTECIEPALARNLWSCMTLPEIAAFNDNLLTEFHACEACGSDLNSNIR